MLNHIVHKNVSICCVGLFVLFAKNVQGRDNHVFYKNFEAEIRKILRIFEV